MIYYNVGRREVGKTTLARYLVRQQDSRIVFDPRGHFPGARVNDDTELIAAFDRLHDSGAGEIIITPDRNVQAMFETTAREVKRWIQLGRTVAFVVDECSLVDLKPNSTADEFDWIIRLCPRRQAIVVMTAHRPVDVPTGVRAIADYWLMFQMTLEHDLDVIEKRCGKVVREEVLKLKPFEFVVWDDAKGTYTINRNKTSWHMPLTEHSAGHVIAAPTIDGDRPLMRTAPPTLFDEP